MGIKSFTVKQAAKYVRKQLNKQHTNAIVQQEAIRKNLISTAANTAFGRAHSFGEITHYQSFKQNIPVRSYEDLLPYFDKISAGEKDVCWPGKPLYLAKTSGTTAGAKIIPITKTSIKHHIAAARNALLCYVAETGKADFFERKMIFLQGSPVLEEQHGIQVGRLSGLVYHHVPAWLLRNRLPSYRANCIEDWEQKLSAIVGETKQADMSLISGIPPWCVMYFELLLQKTNQTNLKALFPNLQLYVYGGLNYEPYRAKMDELLGHGVDLIETFPASEGFFAFQDRQGDKGMLLNVAAGMYFEFIPLAEIHNEHPKRINLSEVKCDVSYVLIVSSDAGLWAYNTGDTVAFTSLKPYKVIVTGRVKHFISAFGEHVIASEVEYAMSAACKALNVAIVEFTVAPYVAADKAQDSYHEWFIEWSDNAAPVNELMKHIDLHLQAKNVYYKDLRQGNMLSLPKASIIRKGGFQELQQRTGKLGGQNKVQHLSNDRKLAQQLQEFILK